MKKKRNVNENIIMHFFLDHGISKKIKKNVCISFDQPFYIYKTILLLFYKNILRRPVLFDKGIVFPIRDV